MRNVLRVVLPFVLLSFAGSASAHFEGYFVGTWSGTVNCGASSGSVSGDAFFFLYPRGSGVTGVAVFDSDADHPCFAQEVFIEFVPYDATTSGTAMNGTFGSRGSFSLTLNEPILSGSFNLGPTSGTVNLTYVDDNWGPRTGTWTGNYSVTDSCGPSTYNSNGQMELLFMEIDGLAWGNARLSSVQRFDHGTCAATASGSQFISAFADFSAGFDTLLFEIIAGSDDFIIWELIGPLSSSGSSGTIDTVFGSGTYSLGFSGGAPTGPSIREFIASPTRTVPGQPVTLTWSVDNATSVSIAPSVGPVPSRGGATVSPSQRTTYTLTASNGSGSSTAQVTVNVIATPEIVVSSIPQGMVQPGGQGGAIASFAVTNNGGAPATIQVSPSASFFIVSPTSFTLQPGQERIVGISGNPVPVGDYVGTADVTGTGINGVLRVPVRLGSVNPPSNPVIGSPEVTRVDLDGPPGASPTGSVIFRNFGQSALRGTVTSDVPWVIPTLTNIEIPPNGGQVAVPFRIDRTLRPGGTEDFGSFKAVLRLTYLTVVQNKVGAANTTVATSSTVTVVDTTAPSTSSTTPGSIPVGQVATFVPGVGHVVGSVGTFLSDLSIVNTSRSRPITDVRMLYSPIGGGGTALQATAGTINPSQPVSFADIVKTVFKETAQVGSLQIRSSSMNDLTVNANIFTARAGSTDPTKPNGTYGTVIPIFRSDRDVRSGESLFLTGMRKDATGHTNLYIQETSGGTARVRTDFLSPAGSVLASRSDTVGPFQLLQVQNPLPDGAVSAVLAHEASGSTGEFMAYATPVDRASGDTWAVVDWNKQFGFTGSETLFIPVAGAAPGANNTYFRTDLAVLNRSTTATNVTAVYRTSTGQRFERVFSLGARETKSFNDVITSLFGVPPGTVGFLSLSTTSGSILAHSRTFTTILGDVATYGTGVPTLASTAAIRAGDVKVIGGVEDSSITSLNNKLPATFRTNFGLVETSGSAAKVRVTVHYSYAAGSTLAIRGSAFKDFDVPANSFQQISRLAEKVIPQRDQRFGDLANLQVEFAVIEGDGRVLVYTSSTDNGTGDSSLRVN